MHYVGVSLTLIPAFASEVPAGKIILGSSEELLPSTCLSPSLLVGETSNSGAENVPSGRGDVGNVRCGIGEPTFPSQPCEGCSV